MLESHCLKEPEERPSPAHHVLGAHSVWPLVPILNGPTKPLADKEAALAGSSESLHQLELL